jgi:phage tail P2-like protein
MSRHLDASSLGDLLPDSISGDAQIQSAVKAVDPELLAAVSAIPRLLIYARLLGAGKVILPPFARLAALNGLPPLEENLVDLLAWQYHVDAYDAAVCYEDKLRLLKNSLRLHRMKGTPWAVKEALRSLGFVDAHITEGYGDEALTNPWAVFDVDVDINGTDGLTDEALARMLRAIAEWKNARSHLRGVRFSLSSPGRYFIACSLEQAEYISVYPYVPDEITQPDSPEYAGSGLDILETIF